MTLLTDLSLLDPTSVTDISSLFFYAVHSGENYKISGRTMADAVMGLPVEFATVYRTADIDLTKTTYHVMSWTNVYTDTYGFREGTSNFTIHNDKIKKVQLMAQGRWEQSAFGYRELILNTSGLPNLNLSGVYDEWTQWNSAFNLDATNQLITPPIDVQSGSSFSLSVRHAHSVNRIFRGGRYCFFSIWGWEGA